MSANQCPAQDTQTVCGTERKQFWGFSVIWRSVESTSEVSQAPSSWYIQPVFHTCAVWSRFRAHESDRTRLDQSTDFGLSNRLHEYSNVQLRTAAAAHKWNEWESWLFPDIQDELLLNPPPPSPCLLQPTVRKSGSRLLTDPSAPTREERESLLYTLSAGGSIW